ncbi:MAG: uracil-DNA glycosylase, partial [Litorimonas sp.]
RRLISSYHCSRYNTNTKRLTEDMFYAIFASAKDYLQQNP